MVSNTQQVFFELVRAGLWEKDVKLSQYDNIDYSSVYRLATEQSVVGLLAAGLEHIQDNKPPQALVLQIIGEALQLEQRNKAMNGFIADIVERMRNAGIYTLIVKGQGVAQCYEKPLWRACGDVDLFLDDVNYLKARVFFASIADSQAKELEEEKHQEFTIGPWTVEIHGNMPSRLMPNVDEELSEIQREAFEKNQTRIWKNGETDVALLSPDNDVIFVFTHILKHFFRGGVGIRQVCDLSRLLWTYRGKFDSTLLESRLRKMGLMSEWRAYGALAVKYLGVPCEAMPFYSPDAKWRRKAKRIISFIIETGNFGHNRDISYYSRYPFVFRKFISVWRHTWDSMRRFCIFPMDSFLVWSRVMIMGVRAIFKDNRW